MPKKGNIPWNKGLTKESDIRVKSISHKGRIPWNKGKSSPIIKVNLTSSWQLSYILGTLIGDGWISTSYFGDYRVGLNTTFKDIADEFIEALKFIGMHPCIRSFKNLGFGKKLMYGVHASARNFTDWYQVLGYEGIEKAALPFPDAFLKGFYLSDGTICDHSVSMCKCDHNKIAMVQRMGEKLGFVLHEHHYIQKVSETRDHECLYYVLDVHGGKSERERFLNMVDKDCIRHNWHEMSF